MISYHYTYIEIFSYHYTYFLSHYRMFVSFSVCTSMNYKCVYLLGFYQITIEHKTKYIIHFKEI